MPSSAKALRCNGVGRVVMTILVCGLTEVWSGRLRVVNGSYVGKFERMQRSC
jgi:hypothetical protein